MKKIISIAGLVAIGCLASCSQDAPEKIASLTPFTTVATVKPLWSVNIGAGAGKEALHVNPAMRNGVIYAGDVEGNIVAVSNNHGEVIWHRHLKEKITSGIGINNNKLVFGTIDGHVVALGRKSGEFLWQSEVAGEVLAAPAVTTNAVFVKTVNGELFALNIQNGKRMWDYSIENPSLTLRDDSAVQTYRNIAVTGFSDGMLVAFDGQSGNVLWRKPLGVSKGASAVERMVDIVADPVIKDGTLYVVGYQGRLAAINVTSGETLWQRDFSSYSGLTVGKNTLYVTNSDSHVWAFERSTGKVLWHNDKLDGRGVSAPSIVAGYVVAGDKKGYVHWLARNDGRFVARKKADSRSINVAPKVSGRNVYVYTSSGKLSAYGV